MDKKNGDRAKKAIEPGCARGLLTKERKREQKATAENLFRVVVGWNRAVLVTLRRGRQTWRRAFLHGRGRHAGEW